MDRRHLVSGGLVAGVAAALGSAPAAPVQLVRTAEGRYAIQLMETTLVLRPEQTENYVGFGFDGR